MPTSTAPASTGSGSRWLRAWGWLWACLTIVHVTQALWISGGRAYPGDLGDGRFNQLVLEHGFQSLCGYYHWGSPGQFYPQAGTLAYSDTHAGTLPLYAALRFASLSRERAWQGWFLIVAALDTWAAFRLFAALGMGRWVRAPLVFAAAGSGTMVWMAGIHPQMLPVFPLLFAWDQLVRWRQDRAFERVAAGAGWFGWQFAASPYTAFFGGVITAAAALAWWLPGPHRETGPRPAAGRNAARFGAVLVFAAGVGLALPVLSVYVGGLRGGETRAIGELAALAPAPADWLSANPLRLVYPAGWPGGSHNLVEHGWFAGFVPLLLLAAAAIQARRIWPDATGQRALVLGLTAVVPILFFTRWSDNTAGLWLWVARHAEGLHAFRASGRVAGVLQFPLIAAGGLLLTWWAERMRSRPATVAVVAIAVLAALENLSVGQPATRVATAELRQNSLVAAWRRAGDRPILAFAPGFTNQAASWPQLDAWSAALDLHRVTINGYSGGVPATHVRLLWEPTLANARAIVARTGLPDDEISFVTALDSAAEKELGFQHQESRPLQHLEGFTLQPTHWALFAPLEQHVVAGRPMYQFTPPAEVRFALPDDVSEISVDLTMRPGSYDGPGRSDGVDVAWIVTASDGEVPVDQLYLNPRDDPEQRKVITRHFRIPPGTGRLLTLRVGVGPNHSGAWDWPLFGNLRAR